MSFILLDAFKLRGFNGERKNNDELKQCLKLEVMVCFIFPGKHLFVFFVLLFSCHVSCVLVNVTRQKLDVFAYPGIFKDCAGFCLKRNSYFKPSSKQGICICQCGGSYQTFVSASLKCLHDKEIRNASE